MTPLPQRKKTAEEIAQLRDQLGVPQGVDTGQAETADEPGADLRKEDDSSSTPLTAPSDPESGSADDTAIEAQPSGVPRDSGGIPARRRTPEELEEMQRREMLSHLSVEPPTHPKFLAAHPALIAIGYLLAAVGTCSFWIEVYPLAAIAAACAGALILAGFIALRRPVSRHHAGFISAISVLVGVFSTIHHLPQLQHAS